MPTRSLSLLKPQPRVNSRCFPFSFIVCLPRLSMAFFFSSSPENCLPGALRWGLSSSTGGRGGELLPTHSQTVPADPEPRVAQTVGLRHRVLGLQGPGGILLAQTCPHLPSSSLCPPTAPPSHRQPPLPCFSQPPPGFTDNSPLPQTARSPHLVARLVAALLGALPLLPSPRLQNTREETVQ